MYTKTYRNRYSSLPLVGTSKYYENGALKSTSSIFGGTPQTYNLDSYKTGDYNPAYRDQIKRAVQAGTNFVGERSGIFTYPSYAVARSTTTGNIPGITQYTEQIAYGGGVGYWTSSPRPSVPLPSVNAAEQIALTEFAKKLQKSQTQFSAGVVAGELRETLMLVRRPASSLRQGISRYHADVKKRLRGARTVKAKNKVVSNTWLEYSFGWKPLVADVEDGAIALARYNLGPRTKRLYAFGVAENATNNLSPVTNPGNLFLYRESIRDNAQVKVSFNGAIAEDPSDDIRRAQLFGVRLEEFLPTVWELIPYSFLVDYFTNIGDMVAAYSYRKIRPAWCIRTVRTHAVRELELVLEPATISRSNPAVTVTTRSGNLTRTFGYKTSIDRSKYSGDFFPSFTVSVPGFQSKKWLNIGALARLRT